MNQTTSLPTAPPPFGDSTRDAADSPARIWSAAPNSPRLLAAEAVQSRFALRVTARLSEGSQTLVPEISERLRFGREQALERARATRHVDVPIRSGVTSGGAALLGGSGAGQRGGSWWLKLASVLPVLALVGGLLLIERWQDNTQVSVAAEIDAALLSDDLPPNAYSDAGFAEYLKNPGK